MQHEARVWRIIAFAAVAALAFTIGRGATPRAEAKSLLLNASHVGTNEDGDVLWVYDYDGANRQWVVMRVDAQKGKAELRTIDHPRDAAPY